MSPLVNLEEFSETEASLIKARTSVDAINKVVKSKKIIEKLTVRNQQLLGQSTWVKIWIISSYAKGKVSLNQDSSLTESSEEWYMVIMTTGVPN